MLFPSAVFYDSFLSPLYGTLLFAPLSSPENLATL